MRRFIHILLVLTLSAGLCSAEGARHHVSLDGGWEFRQKGDSLWMPAQVPGCVHTDLMANGVIEDPFYGRNEKSMQWIGEKDWEYRNVFYLDSGMVSLNNVWLVLEGVDTYAEVSINSLPVVRTDNMFRTWSADIKNVLKAGRNEISILFRSVFSQDMPKYLSAPYRLQAWPNNDQSDIWLSLYARKAGYHYGWDWGPRLITCGIWKPVRIETWEGWRLEDAHIRTLALENVSVKSGKAAKAFMDAAVEVRSESQAQARITIRKDGVKVCSQEVVLQPGNNRLECPFILRKADLWWSNGLGKAQLSDFDVTIESGGREEGLKIRTGIRTAEVIREEDSLGRSMKVRLNGVDVFCKGANWIPIDNFPGRRSYGDYARLISDAEKANMNMLRVWGGGLYECEDFYNVCDSLGIMIWQDMAFACGMFPSDEAYIANVKEEVKDNVRRLRNHPSLMLWCGNNENEISYYEWGWNRTLTASQKEEYEEGMARLFHKEIPSAIMEVDDTRYYHPTSPSTGYNDIAYSMGDAHFWSVWKGGWVEEYLKEHNIARFMSEYGFISYPDMHSLKKFIPEWDLRTDSPSVLAHHRAYDDVTRDPEFSNKMIRRYLERYAWVPEEFADFVYMSQWFQAEAVKTAMEAHRRAKPYCMGTLFWQINDCWPSVSWSSIDYYGRWKALHYYAKRAYAPVIISPYSFNDDTVRVRVVSDMSEEFRGKAEAYILDFDGKVISHQSKDVTVGAEGVKDFFDIPVVMLDGDRVLYVRLISQDRIIADNTYYSRFANSYSYGDAEIVTQVEAAEGGYMIKVSTDRLVRGLYLYTDNENDIFQDNHMDLIPGFGRTIYVESDTPKKEFITTLKYHTL